MELIDTTEVVHRRAARVLLVDAAGRVLLLQGVDPSRPDEPYWMTPGGGIEGDEDPATCAVRELFEETGIRLEPASLAGPVWDEIVDFEFHGVPYRQEQVFYAARVAGGPVAPTRLDEGERRCLLGHRWWRPAEFATTTERYYPRQLPELLRAVVGAAG